MDGAVETVSRRGLFRGNFGARSEAAQGWYSVDGLPAGADDVFWDGWADAHGLFVVGDHGAINHFDGEDWVRQPCPAPVPIHALWGTDRANLWAVGWMGLILHHNGEVWSQVRGCVVDANGKYASVQENTPLFGICGGADGRAWAVGDRGRILYFDGADWTVEDSGTRAHLRAVVILDDGRVMASGGDGTVLMRDLDGSWQALDCPVASNFTAALALPGGRVLLAGGRYFIQANGFRGDLVMWDGEGFEKQFTDMEFSRFRALGQTGKGVVALGDAGQIHLIDDDRAACKAAPATTFWAWSTCPRVT